MSYKINPLYFLTCGFTVSLIAFGYFSSNGQLKQSLEFVTGVAAIATAMGLFFIGYESFLQSRISQASFLDKLAEDVDSNLDTEMKIDIGGELYNFKENLAPEDRALLIKYLTFFERIHVILELGVVPMKAVDLLFSYRFFLLSHNPNVMSFMLTDRKNAPYWTSIFLLHKKWITYKQKRALPIVRPEGMEKLTSHDFYRDAK